MMNIKKSTYQIVSFQLKLRGWDSALSRGGALKGAQQTQTKEKIIHGCRDHLSICCGLLRDLASAFKKQCVACNGKPQSLDFHAAHGLVCKQYLSCTNPCDGYTLSEAIIMSI